MVYGDEADQDDDDDEDEDEAEGTLEESKPKILSFAGEALIK